ncbi:MAG: glycosyltransferase family 2 protein [Bacteroidia bacterium]|nr:glycosyltransferase family 2 protein [Bacteroidia bacterium]
MENPKVYIIIVHFGQVSDTVACVESVLKQNANYEKIVIVNNSENEVDWKKQLNDQSGKLEFIITEANNGYAFACNTGMQFVSKNYNPDYYWILNNDTEVDEVSLKTLLNCASDKINTGLIGSKIYHINKRNVLQGVAGAYNKVLCVTKHVGKGETDNGQFDEGKFSFDYPLGVSLFVRKAFVDEVGMMSDDYFIYFEELDWAYRAKKTKWDVGICTASKIYHKGGASTGAMKENRNAKSALSDFHAIRSRVLFTNKYLKMYKPFLYLFLGILFFEMLLRGKAHRIKMIFRLLKNPELNYVEGEYR